MWRWAPATISSPLRARSAAGGFDDALEDEVGDPDGGLEVEDQPANAALQSGVDAAAELPGLLQCAQHVDLVHDVVKPVLLEPNGARLWYGSQGLGREHRRGAGL